jgi:hypothetical protein
MALTITKVTVINRSQIRVEFNKSPFCVNASNRNDALNRDNYVILGPDALFIESITTERGYPKHVKLTFDTRVSLQVNQDWAIQSYNISCPDGDVITGTFAFTTPDVFEASLSLEAPTTESRIRQFLNKLFKGKNWDALLAALSTGDAYIDETAQLAFDQKYLATAKESYLDRKASELGLYRPESVGIPDEIFRRLAIKSNDKITISSILQIIETLYGLGATHAYMESDPEPFNLNNGDTLIIKHNNDLYEIPFETDDFTDITAATAQELSAVITRYFNKRQLPHFAEAITNESGDTKVRVYSGVIGLGGKISCQGGLVQNILQFPELIPTTDTVGTEYVITQASGDDLRLTWVLVGADPSFHLIHPGDYITLTGTEFTQTLPALKINTDNRGSFVVTKTGLNWIEFTSLTGAKQPYAFGNIVQAADDHFMAYRPIIHTIQNNTQFATAYQTTDNTLEIILPAVSEILNRDVSEAAYLHIGETLAITNGSQSSPLALTTSTNHNLSAGDFVQLENVMPDQTANTGSIADETPTIVESEYNVQTQMPDGTVWTLGTDGLGTDYIESRDATGTYSATALGLPASIQYGPAIVALDNQRVLIAGGDPAGMGVGTQSCYIFDKDVSPTGGLIPTGPMTVARQYHQLIKLNNNKVLCWGGGFGSAEIYDITTGLWSNVATAVSQDLQAFSMCELNNGTIMILGGTTLGFFPVVNLDVFIYNPVNNTVQTFVGVFGSAITYAKMISINTNSGEKVFLVGNLSGLGTQYHVLNVPPLTPSIANSGTLPESMWACGLIKHPNGNPWYGPGYDSTSIPNNRTNVYEFDRNTHDIKLVIPDVGLTAGGATVVDTFLTDIVASGHTVKCLVTTRMAYESYAFPAPNSNGLNNQVWPVNAILAPNQFDIDTGGAAVFSIDLTQNPTVTKIVTEIDDLAGPFIFDPTNGLALSSISTTLTNPLIQGVGYDTITVADTSAFPNEGYLVFNFGTSEQVAGLAYYNVLDATTLQTDPSFVITQDVPAGSDVTLLYESNKYAPPDASDLNAFYLTANTTPRVYCESLSTESHAAGINTNITIVYPGDTGLGNAGHPAKGDAKLSDKVRIWAGDDIDSEVQRWQEEE